ncbi:chaperone modulator CbpM [Flavobacterium sp. W22_SRS_FP1]|uniref:chaperone modulator CbpM n=1 Tax=Flavobacterium sp. W22_SRS_FP1 TaxID=3240276 RepID=UPI003F904F3F
MSIENFIPLETLCTQDNVELAFFSNLNEIGVIEIQTVEQLQYVHQDSIYEIEKMIRMHQDLEVNLEGIDVVFNLIQIN